ncbi:anti-sigma factor family protein [Paenibacillus gorillae]|uniref:anti-sigma factor family protein n=1 Tax=Paenibacillus gorillae TaxID=1243662 RepID=UPI0004B68348|nr:zf-HC2 domain-containing protein [Paenibacillus gorillae]
MNCEDVQHKFSMYWELSEEDPVREEMEAHLLECDHCTEQFRLWEESESLIRFMPEAEDEDHLGPIDHVNRNVMDRIYAEQSWLMPVAQKSYHFSKSFRRNLAIVIAGCMAMFTCALIFFVIDYENHPSDEKMAQLTGLMDTANASGSGLVISAEYEVPVASISDPFVLKVVPAFPQYWAALALLGIIITMLILNWLSRTRN